MKLTGGRLGAKRRARSEWDGKLNGMGWDGMGWNGGVVIR